MYFITCNFETTIHVSIKFFSHFKNLLHELPKQMENTLSVANCSLTEKVCVI